MKSVGLHLRVQKNLAEVIEKALRLKIGFFQNFFITQKSGNYVNVTQEDRMVFLRQRRKYFENLYVHGSYLINGACPNNFQERLLKKELKLATELEFTHYVMHPGSTKNDETRHDGIENLARVLNSACRQFQSITIVIENTAHGNKSIGSDLDDLVMLLEKIDMPDRLAFCIDTAHAHAYGYDLREGCQQPLLEKIMKLGIDRIALIHLNDAHGKNGCKIDRHEIIGAGCIGEAALREFIRQPLFAHIPVLMELPEVPEQEEIRLLEKVQEWLT